MNRFGVGVVLALLVLGGVNYGLTDLRSHVFIDPDPTREDAALRLLGQARTLAAKILWIQVDLYHHEMERQNIAFSKERDVLPLLRFITTLDPQFEDAYNVGAYDLVMGLHDTDAGFSYLYEGLRNNPKSRALTFEAAFLLMMRKRYAEAIPYAQQAISLSHEPMDAMNASRVLAHSARALGNLPLETGALKLCLQIMPQDPYANRRMNEIKALNPVPVQ